MKLVELTKWLLIVIGCALFSACSSDSKDDNPKIPDEPNDDISIMGYWKGYVDSEDLFLALGAKNAGFQAYYEQEDGVVIDQLKYYYDDEANKLILWYEPWDYTVFDIKSITSSSLRIAEVDFDVTDEFGNWPTFDVKTAQQIINYCERNGFKTGSTQKMTRSSKKEFEEWEDEMSI